MLKSKIIYIAVYNSFGLSDYGKSKRTAYNSHPLSVDKPATPLTTVLVGTLQQLLFNVRLLEHPLQRGASGEGHGQVKVFLFPFTHSTTTLTNYLPEGGETIEVRKNRWIAVL